MAELNTKFYRVLKNTPLWCEGAIITNNADGGHGYWAVDSIFTNYVVPQNVDRPENNEYLSDYIVETMPEWFERVYPVNLLTKIIYRTKEQAKEALLKSYK